MHLHADIGPNYTSSIIQDAPLRLAAETPEWLPPCPSHHPCIQFSQDAVLQHPHTLSVESNSSAGRLRMEMMMEMDAEVPRWRGL